MPRDLGDVAHFFLPEAGEGDGRRRTSILSPRRDRPAAVPILTLPVGARDVVRAAFAWNLTVEIARLGASATLLAPFDPDLAALWPEAGSGPVGAEIVQTKARDLVELGRDALDVAVARAAETDEPGIVVVRVPPDWLYGEPAGNHLVRWLLLLSTDDPRDLAETYALAKRLFALEESARVGVTIHGVRRVADARRAFQRLSRITSRHLGRVPRCFGLLVDDLQVYRAIVSRRPIGLEHPQSAAARALRDVAELILEDARVLAIA